MHTILPQIYRVFSIFATLILSLSLAFTLASSVNGYTEETSKEPSRTNKIKGLPKADEVCKSTSGGTADCGFVVRTDDPATLAANISQIITYIIGAVAIIFMLYGAFQYMVGGDKGPEAGKKMIINAIIALIISVAAYGVTATILYFLNNSKVGGA